jgi:hypothetical protein
MKPNLAVRMSVLFGKFMSFVDLIVMYFILSPARMLSRGGVQLI